MPPAIGRCPFLWKLFKSLFRCKTLLVPFFFLKKKMLFSSNIGRCPNFLDQALAAVTMQKYRPSISVNSILRRRILYFCSFSFFQISIIKLKEKNINHFSDWSLKTKLIKVKHVTTKNLKTLFISSNYWC